MKVDIKVVRTIEKSAKVIEQDGRSVEVTKETKNENTRYEIKVCGSGYGSFGYTHISEEALIELINKVKSELLGEYDA